MCKSYAQVGRILHIHPNTVQQIIKRFLRNEGRIVDGRTLRKKEPYNEDFVQQMVSPELLRKWSPFSLAKRVMLISLEFGVQMSRE